MPIRFDEKRWKRIKEDTDKWWAGELERPLIHVFREGRDPGRSEPNLPYYRFLPFYDEAVSSQAIVDRMDYQLSTLDFWGDAFPCCSTSCGPGIEGAFLGAKLNKSLEHCTVWFEPPEVKEVADMHFEYDPDTFWLQRIKDLIRAAHKRWQGLVQVNMTSLCGPLDILSTFRPGGKLMLDLYDNPEVVKRLTWEVHKLWWQYFEEINSVLQPVNPGYSSWAGIFSTEPHYMLQCDLSYMIGPEMFDEFVKPELVASCKRMPNTFYHLDGPGQLAHLDSLLEIKELKGVQWIPGAGNPDYKEWPEVYRKIHAAGKLIQLFGNPETLDIIADAIGTAKGIVFMCDNQSHSDNAVIEFLDRYSVPV